MLRVPLLIPKSNNQCDLRITAAHCMSTLHVPQPTQQECQQQNNESLNQLLCEVRIFASLILGILSVTVHVFMCPNLTDPPL